MIIGIYAVYGNKCAGGGYVYQKSLHDDIVSRLDSDSLNHKIIFFYKGETDLINKHVELCVNTEWYNGGLNEAAIRFHVDIMWFLSISYEELGIPHIIPVWDLQHRIQPFFPEVSSGKEFISRDRDYNHFLPRATYILTGTEEGKKEISFLYRIPADRIIVNPLAFPQYLSKVRIDITDELKDTGLNKNGYLFYPAQFWPHKNHVVLLEALNILKSKYNYDLKLVLTGSEYGNMEFIRNRIFELGLENDVLLPGFVSTESILWLYQNAFALVYPSFFGPDNIPPIEAFSVGCPVIAADVCGAGEQLGDAAILVDPRDEYAFADAIHMLMHEPSFRENLIQKGYSIAKIRTAGHYVQKVLDTIDGFSSVRRCWGAHFKGTHSSNQFEWLNSYLINKEIHSFVTLLSICADHSLEETYNNISLVFNDVVDANKSAEDAIARCEFNNAFEILNHILAVCVDYSPIYFNLARIYYSRSDLDKASEFTKKAHYYSGRLRANHQ